MDYLIKKFPTNDGENPITINEVNDCVTNVQVALCELYERLQTS